jgi:hypothetical protein
MDPPPVVPLLGGLYEICTGFDVVAAGAEVEESEARLVDGAADGDTLASALPLAESSLRSRGVGDETSRAREAPAAKEP